MCIPQLYVCICLFCAMFSTRLYHSLSFNSLHPQHPYALSMLKLSLVLMVLWGLSPALWVSLQLILPFSLLNAVTLKGQETGLALMDSHSYSNDFASPLGPRDTSTSPFYKFQGGPHQREPFGREILFSKGHSLGFKFSISSFFSGIYKRIANVWGCVRSVRF